MFDKFMTPDEIAKLLKVKRRVILNLIRNGKIRAVVVGSGEKRKTYRVYEKEIERFMAENYSEDI